MFTGIIQQTASVDSLRRKSGSAHLAIHIDKPIHKMRLGDSLAVNGCCLTVTRIVRRRSGTILEFDLLSETLQRTNLGEVRPGDLLNIEYAMAANGTMDGHFVTGHVDGMGTVRTWKQSGKDWNLEVDTPRAIHEMLVQKGSIAVDGISLTIANVLKGGFRVWIIPHTLELTNLGRRKRGDAVNLEGDLLGKYVQKYLEIRSSGENKKRR